jgi:hypothetical protein
MLIVSRKILKPNSPPFPTIQPKAVGSDGQALPTPPAEPRKLAADRDREREDDEDEFGEFDQDEEEVRVRVRVRVNYHSITTILTVILEP